MKTESEVRALLLEKAQSDSAFRAALLSDTRATVEKEIGFAMPAGFEMHVHEETATCAHMVLPRMTGRLETDELQAVTGGSHDDYYTIDPPDLQHQW